VFATSIATTAFIMADWNFEQGGSTHGNTADDGWNTGGNIAYAIPLGRYRNLKKSNWFFSNGPANGDDHGNTGFGDTEGFGDGQPGGDDKCFGCGETG
jgi:hypothetical protein